LPRSWKPTGTGKTRTAIKILDRLIAEGHIDNAIIAMDGTDLLDQWASELDGWALRQKPSWLVYKHFERHHELGEFALDPQSRAPRCLARAASQDHRSAFRQGEGEDADRS
jgi:hypothetical protein